MHSTFLRQIQETYKLRRFLFFVQINIWIQIWEGTMSRLVKSGFKLIDLIIILVMIFGSPISALAAVWTDQPDYPPGSVVTIHGDNSDGAGYLPAEIVHVDVIGPNGDILACDGTADEFGAWFCQVTLDPDPAIAVGEYTYTAVGQTSGIIEIGAFTDSGGAYTINFAAADPVIYIPPVPFPAAVTPIVGRGDGDTEIPDAWFTEPGGVDVKVESLAPDNMALGQVVPFEIRISVDGAVTPENGVITFIAGWNIETSSNDAFGYDENYGVIAAFVDTGDGAFIDPEGDATVSTYTWEVTGDEIQGTFTVTGLDDGDVVVVEAWLVLDATIPVKVSGNVPSRLIDAWTGNHLDDISTGNQTVPLLQAASFFSTDVDVSVTKSDSPDPVNRGDQLTYTLVVNNAGPNIANGVIVTDTLDPNTTFVSASVDDGLSNCTASAGVISCDLGAVLPSLPVTVTITVLVNENAPTAGTTATGNCTVGQTGVDLCNTVSVTTISDDTQTTNNSDSEPTDVPAFVPAAAIDVEKSVSVDGGATWVDADTATGPYLNSGTNPQFQFVVTNTGNMELSSISLSDTHISSFFDSDLTTPCTIPSTLAVGETFTCYASLPWAAGQHTNTATADSAESLSDSDDANYFGMAAALTIDKTVIAVNEDTEAPFGVDEAGDVIHYSILVTNSGNQTLTDVTVSDLLISDLDCDPDTAGQQTSGFTIVVGGSLTCTGSYTVTQGDIDGNGGGDSDIDNTATADSGQTGPSTDSEFVPLVQKPALTIDKTAEPATYDEVGDEISYSYLVTNTGNVTLYDISIIDDKVTVICPDTSLGLGPNQTVTCTATYQITQADLDAGALKNTAYATDGTTDSTPDEETVNAVSSPALSLTKSADPTTYDAVDQVITYSYEVQNTGNVTLSGPFSVDDDKATVTCTQPADGELEPGETMDCTAIYAITQDDLDIGFVTNTATATNGTITSNEAQATVDAVQNYAFTVAKTASLANLPEPGGSVTFTVNVTNIGNTTLNLTSLQDNVYGDIADDTNTKLNSTTCETPQTIPVNEYYECTFNADVTGGPGVYTDTVTATANEVEGSDDAAVTITDVPSTITVDKSASPASLPESGGSITFDIVVTNTSSVDTVTINSLTDDIYGNLDGQGTCDVSPAVVLAPGATYSCQFTGAVSGNAGESHTNVATASGTDDDGVIVSATDDAAVTLTDLESSILLTKDAAPTTVDEPGGDVNFDIVVTNTSSVDTVTINSLTDDIYGNLDGRGTCDVSPAVVLAPGATYSCQFTGAVSGNAGESHTNVATASGTDDDGGSVSDSDDAIVTINYVPPTVDLEKEVDSLGTFNVGDVSTFTLSIKNTSPRAVTISAIDDTQTTACDYLLGKELAANDNQPGGPDEVTCTYSVTHKAAGVYPNTASVTIKDDQDNTDSDEDTQTINVYEPAVSKTVNGTYQEIHDWAVFKSVSKDTQYKYAGQTANFTWTVRVEANAYVGDYSVSGVITVVNPNPDDPMVMTLSDVLDDGSVATITGCQNGTWIEPNLTVPAATTATCNYAATPLGNLNALEQALPDQVTMSVVYGPESYWVTTITNGGALNGTYEGWCADIDEPIDEDTYYQADVYSSYETIPPGYIEKPQNLDLVNWVINQDFVGKSAGGGLGNYTYGDVQRAIWELLEDNPHETTSGLGSWNQVRVDQIEAAAKANGEGFVPTCGDFVAILLVPTNGDQIIAVAQVTFASLGINCAQSNVVTAVLNGVTFRDTKPITWAANPVNSPATLADDQNPALSTSVTDDATFTYDDSYVCPDVSSGLYTNGKYVYTENNTATLKIGDRILDSALASTRVTCLSSVPQSQALTITKTVVPMFQRVFTWDISKEVDKTLVEKAGGSAVFNYTVNVRQTGVENRFWAVNGKITVTNPNTKFAIGGVDVTDTVNNGGDCSVANGTDLTIPAGGSVVLNYTCTYASAPTSHSGLNIAAATWEASPKTPGGTATHSASFAFDTGTTGNPSYTNRSITVTDSFQGTTKTLGTVIASTGTSYVSKAFNYARTVSMPSYGCKSYPNTARIAQTGQVAGKTITVCGPIKLGGRTISYWQGSSGQGIIKYSGSSSSICKLTPWLRQFAPFQDLSATASCRNAASYVYNTMRAATSYGATMNKMLKAQMLATALDVYFSDPALGSNKISAPVPIGGVTVDLTSVKAGSSYQDVGNAFGSTTSMTVLQMLNYAANQSNVGGSTWYDNIRSTQELAKNAFNAINSNWMFAP